MLSSLCAQNSRSVDSDPESEPGEKWLNAPCSLDSSRKPWCLTPATRSPGSPTPATCAWNSMRIGVPFPRISFRRPPRAGSKAATYKYRLWLNDQLVGHGEVILREK